MGWFDKKSWQLRRKIRDLQSELAAAEREGKYVVCQGLFFAELAEMGNETIMVLGKADTFDTEEEAIIKSFFERNGFTVESIRLDKTHKTLATIEIIPPEEFIRRVARVLKDNNFKLIDDSEHERPSAMENRVVTLSSLIRSISALFASHVHNLIVTTPIKMNMEGNRLLHWMPLIRDALLPRVPPALVDECKQPFVDAYNHYYGQFGQIESTDSLSIPVQSTDGNRELDESLSDQSSTPWTTPVQPPAPEPSETVSSRLNSSSATAPATNLEPAAQRAVEAAQTISRVYKSLIGASKQRKTHNAEVVLDYIARFFSARSACLLGKPNQDTDDNITLLANSNSAQCLATNADGTVACDATPVLSSIRGNTIVSSPPSNGNTNSAAVAVPVSTDSGQALVLYLVEPATLQEQDNVFLQQFAQVFREFPDLLLNVPANKS